MWLTGLQVVTPDHVIDRASLCIEGDRIAEVIEGDMPRADIDARGLTAIPGLIDSHGDMLEREISPRPGVRFPFDLALFELDKRYAAAGVTTAYAAIGFSQWADDADLRSEEKARLLIQTIETSRESLLSDIKIHARFEISNHRAAPALRDLLVDGRVQLLSLMDHTPGQGQYRNTEHYIDYIAKWRKVPREAIEQGVRERIARARQTPSCWDIVEDLARLAAACDIPVASHDDDTFAKVQRVASICATISEFPVTLAAAREAKRQDMSVCMGAPNLLIGGSHSGNLGAREALEAGLVDMLAADYSPGAMMGALSMIVATGLLPLNKAVNLVTQHPAKALGLHDRGSIQVGKKADIVLVEFQEECSRVHGVVRDGVPIYWDRHMASLCRQSQLWQVSQPVA